MNDNLIPEQTINQVFNCKDFGTLTPLQVIEVTLKHLQGGFLSPPEAMSCCEQLGLIEKVSDDYHLSSSGEEYLTSLHAT